MSRTNFATLSLRLLAASALFVLVINARATPFIPTVPVGSAGNPHDASGFGGVAYDYRIGKHEVTIGQYVVFLNSVAADDTYSLYHPIMGTDHNVAGISRSGSSGSYTYSAIGSPNMPVTHVSWGDAARFCNWLHNGQPTGTQNLSTTEDGAYFLNGDNSNTGLKAVTRKADANWFIPSANEWYKAAYYQPTSQGGDSDGYWKYPMRTNNTPYSDQPPGNTPDNTRVGNFRYDDGVANGYNDGHAVSGTMTFDDQQVYLTDVGAYATSGSFYGTYDQGGNAWEWTESVYQELFRILRRRLGVLRTGQPRIVQLGANKLDSAPPQTYSDDQGFRVAMLPPWRNRLGYLDVDNDGEIIALDALIIVNELNAHGGARASEHALRRFITTTRTAMASWRRSTCFWSSITSMTSPPRACRWSR